jgi:hypothetical protein
MTTNEKDLNSKTTPSSVDAHLDRYTPSRDYSGQWERLRPEILGLIRKIAPQTTDQLHNYLAAIGVLLEGELPIHRHASMIELLTDAGINRTVARLNLTRASRMKIQGHRTSLTHLHRILHGLPPIISSPRQKRVASDLITAPEVDEILNYLSKPRKAMDFHVTRRFFLALGAGLTGAKADAAQIHFNDLDITAVTDRLGRERPISKKWFDRLYAVATPDLEKYKRPSEQALRAWLRNESLSYLWPRLRDERLLEQMDSGWITQ